MRAVNAAFDVLNERLCAADAIAKAFYLAGGDDPPPWVHVFRDQIEAISTACEAIEVLSGGIGVVHPDEAKRNGIEDDGADLALQRGDSVTPRKAVPHRPEKQDVLSPENPVFLSPVEKSSAKSTR